MIIYLIYVKVKVKNIILEFNSCIQDIYNALMNLIDYYINENKIQDVIDKISYLKNVLVFIGEEKNQVYSKMYIIL